MDSYYNKHKEVIKARACQYQKDNREEYNKYMREYRKKHKEAYVKLQ